MACKAGVKMDDAALMNAPSWSRCFSRKRILALLSLGCLALMAGVIGCHFWIKKTTEPLCTSQIDTVKEAPVALVLGCSPWVAGRKNLFYEYRIEAAASLFKAGKVKALIVSGDNGSKTYDEPTMMKESLVANGVPEAAIYCDYAGFRTLDSVVRAKTIFQQSHFIVVSQRFHNERAVFLAQRHGLQASGFDARDVPRHAALKTSLREYLARVQAVLDVTLFQTSPKFAGPAVQIWQATNGSPNSLRHGQQD